MKTLPGEHAPLVFLPHTKREREREKEREHVMVKKSRVFYTKFIAPPIVSMGSPHTLIEINIVAMSWDLIKAS